MLVAVWLFAAACYADDGEPATPARENLPVTTEDLPVTTDAFTDIAIGLLAESIVESRDLALSEGTDAVPPTIRSALAGYVAQDLLDAVRWRVGTGSGLSLQQGMFMLGDSPAITLDHVIVFESTADANDPKLWVHELMHVMQFKRWGISDFARRYIVDYEAVETEAVEFRWRWMKLTNRVPPAETQE
jgi:hypothetical protein